MREFGKLVAGAALGFALLSGPAQAQTARDGIGGVGTPVLPVPTMVAEYASVHCMARISQAEWTAPARVTRIDIRLTKDADIIEMYASDNGQYSAASKPDMLVSVPKNMGRKELASILKAFKDTCQTDTFVMVGEMVWVNLSHVSKVSVLGGDTVHFKGIGPEGSLRTIAAITVSNAAEMETVFSQMTAKEARGRVYGR